MGVKPTEYGRLFVRTNVVISLVKQHSQLLTEYLHKPGLVLVIYQAVMEHSEAFMDPETCHRWFCVVEVFMSS